MQNINHIEQNVRIALNHLRAVDANRLDPDLQELFEIHKIQTRLLYERILNAALQRPQEVTE
jgi:hypothetical protein